MNVTHPALFLLVLPSLALGGVPAPSYDSDVDVLTQAIRVNPGDASVHAGRGHAHLLKKEYAAAIADYDQSLRLEPRSASVRVNRAYALLMNHQDLLADKEYTEAIRLAPWNPIAFVGRGKVRCRLNDHEAAMKDYVEALRLDPKSASATAAQAWLLATSPVTRLRDGARAVTLATRACEWTNWKDAECLGVLASAHAERGEFVKAIKWQAVALALGFEDEAARRQARQRLVRYEARQPITPPRPRESTRKAPESDDETAAGRSPNFAVDAPTPQLARKIARAAERFRQARALEWLGEELPQWPVPCPIRVDLTPDGFSAANVKSDQGVLVHRDIVLKGSDDRMVTTVLPHEMTHLILAPLFVRSFGHAAPRWADEGAAVLSSSDLDRQRFDGLMRGIPRDQLIPLRRLFAAIDYPSEWRTLYAEGYTVTRFLVASRDRQTFLAFLAQAAEDGWDEALREHFGYADVEALEQAWLQSLTYLWLDENSAWVGQEVMTAKARVSIRQTDPATGRVVKVADLDEGIYTVLREKGGWIRVRHRGIEGWFEKADAVRLADAVSFFTRKIRANQDDAEAYARRGRAREARGEVEKAVEDASAAIRINPMKAAWYNHRGNSLVARKAYARALADFNQALRLAPRSSESYGNRGNAYRGLGDHDQAIASYGAAIRLAPTSAAAYFNRALAFEAKHDFAHAVADFSTAIRLEPTGSAAVLHQRGRAYWRLKRYDEAMADYNLALLAGDAGWGQPPQNAAQPPASASEAQ